MSRVRSEEMRAHLPLYLVMGSVNCRMDPVQVAEEALAGGVSVLQYREKGRGALIGDDKKRLGAELQAVCKRHGVPFIVNDDLELALELGADGIHIGQQDERADRVRSRIGDLMLGVSAHTVEEVRLAIEQGADYLGIGPIYPTQSKEDALEAQGPLSSETSGRRASMCRSSASAGLRSPTPELSWKRGQMASLSSRR